MLLERFCLKALSPGLVYKLVLITPFAVLISNLPDSFKPLQNNQISYYLISLNTNYLNNAEWEWAYAYFAVTILLLFYTFTVHMHFISKLGLRSIELILEHESTHIQRKDNLNNGLVLLCTLLPWFNPIA